MYMKILLAIKSSVFRSLKIWKSVTIVWFVSLLLSGLLSVPVKNVLNSGFSNSMITEKLAHGINIEVFTDLGVTMSNLISFLKAGFYIAILVSILLNAFLAGGLFHGLKSSSERFSTADFFRDSARKFWSFLVINLIMSIIFFTLLFLVVILPVAIVSQSDSPSEGAVFRTLAISLPVFFLIASIILLVVDYGRAWQAAQDRIACFRAIGFGFKQTFLTFFSSTPMMLLILIVQFLFGWLVLSILPGFVPQEGGGVFLLLILSQSLFFIKIFLKTWRYGSVTVLMESSTNSKK